MYIAKYELNNSLKVKQYILKINILDNNKNIIIYNFCLKNIININKNLYLNIGFRMSIYDSKIELVLFFTSKENFLYIYKLKEKIMREFTSKECHVQIPKDRYKFDDIITLDNSLRINRLHNSSYYITHKKIGIDFNIGSFIENIINISIKRNSDFSYQFQLKPYSVVEKKELERYGKKYILRLEDEVYMPNNLNQKLHSITDNISNMDFFIDEVFSFEEENKEFYEMILSNEFALKLSQYGFEELPFESDELAENLIHTGLSSLFMDDIDEVEQIFSSISQESLKQFLLEEPRTIIKSYSDNNIVRQYDIFISYSTVNTTEAEKVCYELEEVGYKCWYAPRDILPSRQYPEEIIRGIKSAKYFVLLHSKDSTVSRYVVREVTKALSLNKIIIPILLDSEKISQNMEFILETCQWIDASQANFDEKIGELKDVLDKLI